MKIFNRGYLLPKNIFCPSELPFGKGETLWTEYRKVIKFLSLVNSVFSRRLKYLAFFFFFKNFYLRF